MATKKIKKSKREALTKRAYHGKKVVEVTINRIRAKAFDEEALASFIGSILPPDHDYTVAQAVRGKTYRVFDRAEQEQERFFIPNEKFPQYSGLIGFGAPQLRRMLDTVGPEYAGAFCQVRQGQKKCWYTAPRRVAAYLVARYAAEQAGEILGDDTLDEALKNG